MTPEAKVKLAVRSVLDKYKAYYFFPPANGYGRAGIPDVVACLPNGRFLAIECKAGKGKPTALQLRELAKIAEARGYARIVYEKDIQELDEWLSDISKHN